MTTVATCQGRKSPIFPLIRRQKARVKGFAERRVRYGSDCLHGETEGQYGGGRKVMLLVAARGREVTDNEPMSTGSG